MRPVNKWPVGHVYNTHTILNDYNPYSSSKPYLEANIGRYCSYCERIIDDEAMHVEHVQPYSLAKYKSLEYTWTNFLVSCHRCNGKDTKSNKDVVFVNTHLPHLNNTFKSISYYADGSVRADTNLVGVELARAKFLIDLVGLDRIKGHPKHLEGDKRAERRSNAWEYAERCKSDYELLGSSLTPNFIAVTAAKIGHWSVWMKVFERHDNVRSELISAFNNTFSDCRTTDVNRNPIP